MSDRNEVMNVEPPSHCDPVNGCPPDTHNIHCGYPDCAKGRAVRDRPENLVDRLHDRIAELEAENADLREQRDAFRSASARSSQAMADHALEIGRFRTVMREMGEALTNLRRGARCHIFMRASEADTDTCSRCGGNFRNADHLRASEGHPSDVLREALLATDAALAKWKEMDRG